MAKKSATSPLGKRIQWIEGRFAPRLAVTESDRKAIREAKTLALQVEEVPVEISSWYEGPRRDHERISTVRRECLALRADEANIVIARDPSADAGMEHLWVYLALTTGEVHGLAADIVAGNDRLSHWLAVAANRFAERADALHAGLERLRCRSLAACDPQLAARMARHLGRAWPNRISFEELEAALRDVGLALAAAFGGKGPEAAKKLSEFSAAANGGGLFVQAAKIVLAARDGSVTVWEGAANLRIPNDAVLAVVQARRVGDGEVDAGECSGILCVPANPTPVQAARATSVLDAGAIVPEWIAQAAERFRKEIERLILEGLGKDRLVGGEAFSFRHLFGDGLRVAYRAGSGMFKSSIGSRRRSDPCPWIDRYSTEGQLVRVLPCAGGDLQVIMSMDGDACFVRWQPVGVRR